jgi:glycosyltransferase involved in cell wall biosynthesis
MSLSFSIITVCKNSQLTISRTIQSVLSQTYTDLELIIVDGASTDSTLEIIKDFNDERIRLISEFDSGIYNAMNKGIALSDGDVVAILNSDDFYLPDALERIKSEFDLDKSLAILCSDVFCVEVDGSVTILTGEIESLKSRMVPHPGVFMRRDLPRVSLNFREDLKIAADYDLLLRNLTDGVKMKHFQSTVACYSKGGFSDTPRNRILSLHETYLLQRFYFQGSTIYQRKQLLWNGIVTLFKRSGKMEMLSTIFALFRKRNFN